MIKDLTNMRFGRLTAIKPVGRKVFPNGKSCAVWLCKCDCGNKKEVLSQNLCGGSTKSCGCLLEESRRTNKVTHGMSNSRLYSIWRSMLNRCNNPNRKAYSRYGGRGIKVCGEWGIFSNFKEWALSNGYADDLTIERINNDGDYCPTNCKWITKGKQAENRSRTKRYEYQGKTYYIRELSEMTGIKPATLYARLERYGFSIEQSLKTPRSAKVRVGA